MAFWLTEEEKLIIIILASSLFLLSVIITICIVSPICLLHKLLFKSGDKLKSKNGHPKQQLITPESKLFQLSVVPHYGYFNAPNSPIKIKGNSIDTNGAIFNNNNNTHQCDVPITLKAMIVVENVNENNVRINITIDDVTVLKLRGYGIEPSSYATVDIFWHGPNKSRRKHLKPVASFQTVTVKRCLNPVFSEKFVTSELPKSILKDGSIKIRVMEEERYANDVCVGEMSISLRKLHDSPKIMKPYTLIDPKEIKGELLVEMCYRPTSYRMTFSVTKATLCNGYNHAISPSLLYYIRILMFVNGKLTKKKKSLTSSTLNWGNEEILIFEFSTAKIEDVSFMIVLSSRTENTTVSSPETPNSPEAVNDSRKDKHIGHYIIGRSEWMEIKVQPRKQIIKWVKII